MNILQEIAAHALCRVEQERARVSLEELKRQCFELVGSKARSGSVGGGEGGNGGDEGGNSGDEGSSGCGADCNAFEAALRKPGMSFICEVKKASPSKGVISPDFPYLDIARDYQAAGADCISCLTEPRWFQGSDQIFREIRQAVSLPMLRKDFVVDEYQIYQAKVLGADAVLLICALLDRADIVRYLQLCGQLGLSALVEAHNETEISSALAAGARIIGVNNRNLKNFQVDITNAARLRQQVPPHVLYVAESGVSGPEDVAVLRESGADAVLIGEALMSSRDRQAMLTAMKKGVGR
ncbi:MAG: indole-3-glycerol phosphate synthase TrpC [Clostridiales bacterium]